MKWTAKGIGVNGNLYDIHKQYGLSTPPVAVDKNQAEKVVQTAWSGANYSRRIWKNGAKLESAIKETMLTAIHRGTSIQKLSNELAKRMETGYNNAERLIRTELNYVQTRAAADSIVSAEMGYYQFIAVMDNRTTPICQSLDGEIFPIIELSQGENAPPMHVRCRSTIAASEDDGKQGRKPVGQRAARDENGKRIKVPADMTYRDWKAVYIDKTQTLEDWRKAKDAEYAAAKGIPSGNKLPFKRQAHFSTSDENVLATNPRYALGLEYQQNCQRCVPAYEMRMRGYDVIARPTYDLDTDIFASKHWKEAFEDAVIEENLAGTGKEDIIKRMIEWGDGARAEVYVVWENGDSHVFVAENRNNHIHFLDPQTGEIDVERYFEDVKEGFTKLLQINTLEFNNKNIKWCCKEVK